MPVVEYEDLVARPEHERDIVFDKEHADIHVTAVYTGSYDDTNVKTRAAIPDWCARWPRTR